MKSCFLSTCKVHTSVLSGYVIRIIKCKKYVVNSRLVLLANWRAADVYNIKYTLYEDTVNILTVLHMIQNTH